MYNFDKDAFRRYFFDGEDNPNGALEGIIYHIYTESISKKVMKEVQDDEYWIRKFENFIDENTEPVKIIEDEIGNFREKDSEEIKRKITMFINEVEPVYKQYYRFIELNNQSGVYSYKDYRLNEQNNESETNHELLIEKELKKRIGQRIRKLRDEGKINVTEQGIFYSKDQMRQYRHFMEGSMTVEEWKREYGPLTIYNQEDWELKNIPNDMNTWYTMKAEGEEKLELDKNGIIPYQLEHWTKAMSKILLELNKIEKEDEKAYLDLWLRTRLKRAKSTKHPIQGIQEKEIQRLEYMCKEVRNVRLLQENKEDMER